MTETDFSKMFSLQLSGDGINVKQEVDQRTALQIVQIVMGGQAFALAPTSAASTDEDASSTTNISLSLREYLDQTGASKKPDQITAIAHYVCEYEKQEDFSRDDIRTRFLTAREPLPGNFGRDFAVALKNGWLAEVHGKKNRLYVTAKGIQAINNNFSSGRRTSPRSKPSRAKL